MVTVNVTIRDPPRRRDSGGSVRLGQLHRQAVMLFREAGAHGSGHVCYIFHWAALARRSLIMMIIGCGGRRRLASG